ncbi:MAG: glycosyltransferase family 39 protein [Solirubrobacterales bacterium]
METAALRRGSLAQLADACRRAVSERSGVFWAVVGLTALAAALRFATLGAQSYHHDEVVTAARVLRGTLGHAVEKIGSSESAPPLYYLIAWFWTQLTGTGEVGLRSISALAGVATVPVAYLIGAELRGRRAGISAAALVATNPMLVWYSREARCYSLLVLLGSAALLFFLRARRSGSARDLNRWALFSALALASHYFAIFPAAAEAVLLLRRRGRAVLRPLAWVALAGLVLVPLALLQAGHTDHIDWIERQALLPRLGQAGVAFMVGETGEVISQPVRPLLALVPALLAGALLLLLAFRADRRDRNLGAALIAVAAFSVLAPTVLALAGKDFVIARNLIGALVPLLAALALAATLPATRRAGAALCAGLLAYSLGFTVWASFDSSLQRPDWRGVAHRLGEPREPRALVTWVLGAAPLRYYLPSSPFQVEPRGERWYVHEVDLVSKGPLRSRPAGIGPQFRRAGSTPFGRLVITRFRAPGLAHLGVRALKEADLGFPNSRVLLDGIGPPA